MQPKNHPLDSRWDYLCLLFSISPSLVWIFGDRQVWPWDQAWYAEVSTELYYYLLTNPAEWFKRLMSAFGFKAPGVAWFGQFFVPIGQLLGSIEIGLLLSIFLTQFLTLVLTYQVIKKLTHSRPITIATCLLVSAAPLSLGLAHQYVVETLQTFAITWVVYIGIMMPEWRLQRSILQLMGAFALSMLAKVTSPLYLVGAAAIIGFHLTKQVNLPSLSQFLTKIKTLRFKDFIFLLSPLNLLSLIFTVTMVWWYGVNWQQIIAFGKLASSGEAALLYGEKADFLSKFEYWLIAFQKSFFSYSLAIICLAAFIYILTKFLIKAWKQSQLKSNQPDSNKLFDYLAIISVVQILLVLSALSLNVNQENRYLLPLLPYIIIVLAWLLFSAGQRLMLYAFMGLISFQLLFVNAQALGVVAPNDVFSYWLHPFQRDESQKQLLTSVVESTCNEAGKYRYNIIGTELQWFNANSAAFYSAQQLLDHDYRCYFTSLGYAENDPLAAWKRLLELNINFFVTLKPAVLPRVDAFNRVTLPTLNKIQASPLFTPANLVDESSVLLYKRTSPETN